MLITGRFAAASKKLIRLERWFPHQSSQPRCVFSNCILCYAICRMKELENTWVRLIGFSYHSFLNFFFSASMDTTTFPCPSRVWKKFLNDFGRDTTVEVNEVLNTAPFLWVLALFSFPFVFQVVISRWSRLHSNTVNPNTPRGVIKPGDQAYDGLWDRNCPGTGLQKGPLTTPAGYIPSSCFYVHLKFV